jgi:hypothetical protein
VYIRGRQNLKAVLELFIVVRYENEEHLEIGKYRMLLQGFLSMGVNELIFSC